ncbi:Gfo/Idh/MocA family oxidoreductase [candidate division KSB1 bacterium]|nr:Gfo/Idh/MocA family oxidoreductase [candidate division KSB1 bacterium]
MHEIKTVVIGAGFMGPAHTEALRRLNVNVSGILGVNNAESKRAEAALGLKAYESFQQVLDDSSVNVVHITTPNRLHYQMARDALAAGKHVLCEKPLANNSKESAELVKIAADSNLAAGVNYNMRFYPLCLEAKKMLRSGELGRVYSITGSYVQDWLLYPTDYNWRVLAEEGGELRAVADIGTHWLDMIYNITGLEVESLCADLKTVHPVRRRPKGEVETFSGKVQKIDATEAIDITTDDCGSIMLRFTGGAIGHLWVSQTTAGRKNCLRYEIAAEKNALAWNSEQPNELWIGHRKTPNQLLLKDPGLLSGETRNYVSYPGGHNEGYPDSFKQCFKAFYTAIKAKTYKTKPDFPTFADGHKEILLCEAVLESHRKGGWIRVKK